MKKNNKEVLAQRKADREIIWNAIKGRKFINTKTARRLAGFESTHYVAHRMKELMEEGKIELIKDTSRSRLWEVNREGNGERP